MRDLESDPRHGPFTYFSNQPIIHSEQMYQAMKHLGREASLVVYPGAYHGIRRPVYQKDLLERFLGWFGKYVKGAPSGS